MCYDRKVFQVHQLLRIPGRMARFSSWALEPIFSSSEPTSEARVGMGATVDIQRQQRMEQLDRQLVLSQFAQVRRQRQQQVRRSACVRAYVCTPVLYTELLMCLQETENLGLRVAFVSVRGFVFKVTRYIRAEQLIRMDILIPIIISERNFNLVSQIGYVSVFVILSKPQRLPVKGLVMCPE